MFFSQLSIVVFTGILIKKHNVLHDSAVFSMLVNSNNLFLRMQLSRSFITEKPCYFFHKIILMLK